MRTMLIIRNGIFQNVWLERKGILIDGPKRNSCFGIFQIVFVLLISVAHAIGLPPSNPSKTDKTPRVFDSFHYLIGCRVFPTSQ
jgi:hypothetical protein